MEYAITVFFLGLMVSALVAKGIMQANDYANEELKRQDAEKRSEKSPE